MQDIDFEWEVLETAPGANSMMVKFTPINEPDLAPIIIGMQFPPEGVDVADHVEQFTPEAIWGEQRVKRVHIEAGAKGRKGVRGGKRVERPQAPVETPAPEPQPDLIVEAFKV